MGWPQVVLILAGVLAVYAADHAHFAGREERSGNLMLLAALCCLSALGLAVLGVTG